MTRGGAFVKRSFDVAISATLLLLTAPVIAACAIAIAVVSPGSPFFAQHREGRGRRAFRMYKLRTMQPDAERRLKAHLAGDAEAAREWRTYRRLRDDPRLIPVVGRLLRRASLDELPQLWNVLRGDMSLVGPRPLELDVAASLADDARNDRASVRPGMTGLWQISGRSEATIEEMSRMDGDYLRDWRLTRDVVILARTPAAVLTRRGAY